VPGRNIARTFPFPHAVYPSSATTPGNGLLGQGSRTGPSHQQSMLWGLLSRPTPLWTNPRASAVQRSWLANLSALVAFRTWGHQASKLQGVCCEVVPIKPVKQALCFPAHRSAEFPLPGLVKAIR
jgi:hypothetical protein